MNERDIEMHEQNDPLAHAAGEVDASIRDESGDAETGRPDIVSPTNPEMRREGAPDAP